MNSIISYIKFGRKYAVAANKPHPTIWAIKFAYRRHSRVIQHIVL